MRHSRHRVSQSVGQHRGNRGIFVQFLGNHFVESVGGGMVVIEVVAVIDGRSEVWYAFLGERGNIRSRFGSGGRNDRANWLKHWYQWPQPVAQFRLPHVS